MHPPSWDLPSSGQSQSPIIVARSDRAALTLSHFQSFLSEHFRDSIWGHDPDCRLCVSVDTPKLPATQRFNGNRDGDVPHSAPASWAEPAAVLEQRHEHDRSPSSPSLPFSATSEPQEELPSRNSQFGRPSTPVFHIFSQQRKRRVIVMLSLAAIFSPLSSNIYFPALVTISKDLHTAIELITLSITIYLVVQGVAPSFWGPLSDQYGRRPVFLATLSVYLVANLGLGLSRSFAALMFFRALQSGGSSATIALGSGVISDITTRAERGGFVGIFGGIRMFGQAFGPVLGGALAQYLGFRSIFWFLLISATIVTTVLYLFFPETLRDYAGDGSIPQHGVYQQGIELWTRKLRRKTSKSWPGQAGRQREPLRPSRNPLSWKTFQCQLELLIEKDVLVALLYGSVIYTVWSMITATTSTLFQDEYKLSDVQIGLIFLPNGLGCVLGSYATGIVMDREFKTAQRRFNEAWCHQRKSVSGPHCTAPSSDHDDFPLERARLRPMWVVQAVFVLAVGAYGWTLETHIAGPLALQFVIALAATAAFNITSTMMIDLYPSKPASATAINNFVRCILGAVGVGVVEKLRQAYKERILFTALSAFVALSTGLLVMEWIYGQEWRKSRTE